ncbi:ABC transporter permease [Protaetiibacter mangrovi]|uniref:Transport permease protein n=1 Tax=Protaetiibacter mangrovi TaxID=2970926 RepID=A0ABT1ZE74_9MICO|nr:ABC transporter permease [Protaetiibacter mangrovi]MCS0499014.1 ABC transporter permease [Protaetiibacter mangrovi]TPW99805.1 ABC transporter permease [Schumannella luteola]
MTALTTTPLASPPRPTTVFATFVARSMLHTLRTPDALIMAIALPTILMVLFTQVFGGAIDPSGGYVDYVVPGIILLCAGFGAASTAVDVANDMKAGVIERFRTMPFRAETVIAGHVVASLVRNLVATAIVILVAVLLGFRPSATPLEWAATFALVAAYILAITYLFAAIGLAASSPEAASGYGFFLMFLPYLSSAFVPVDTMPEWLRWIADNQPLTPIIETIRGLLLGTEIGADGWWAIGWCALILAVALVLTRVLFRAKAGRR